MKKQSENPKGWDLLFALEREIWRKYKECRSKEVKKIFKPYLIRKEDI